MSNGGRPRFGQGAKGKRARLRWRSSGTLRDPFVDGSEPIRQRVLHDVPHGITTVERRWIRQGPAQAIGQRLRRVLADEATPEAGYALTHVADVDRNDRKIAGKCFL